MHSEQIDNKKTDILFEQGRIILLATLLGVAVVTFTYWPHIDLWILLSWLAAMTAITGARYYLIHNYVKNKPAIESKPHLRRYFNIGAFLGGSLWGCIGAYVILTQPLHLSAVVVLLCGYLVISASLNYSIFMSSFMAFVLPIFVPVTASLLLGSDIITRTYGALLIIFLIYAFISALRQRAVMASFIAYEIDNNSLLEDLRRKQHETRHLNRELEEDLTKLRKAEEQLRQEKAKAEELAARLQTISSQDGLTGIANRRSFDEFLAREWNRAIRSQTPLSLIMCDIDHFKPYNDYFGHQKGDKCLIRIAQILDEHARRGGDLAARYGGEEFTIILPETSLENATEMAEQMRRAIQDTAILHPASEMEKIVTMSFGVATIVPRQGQSPNTLIAIADKALYQAKQEGRNRVIPARPGLLDQPPFELEG